MLDHEFQGHLRAVVPNVGDIEVRGQSQAATSGALLAMSTLKGGSVSCTLNEIAAHRADGIACRGEDSSRWEVTYRPFKNKVGHV